MLRRHEDLLGHEPELLREVLQGVDGGAVDVGLAGLAQAPVAHADAEALEHALERRWPAIHRRGLHDLRREEASASGSAVGGGDRRPLRAPARIVAKNVDRRPPSPGSPVRSAADPHDLPCCPQHERRRRDALHLDDDVAGEPVLHWDRRRRIGAHAELHADAALLRLAGDALDGGGQGAVFGPRERVEAQASRLPRADPPDGGGRNSAITLSSPGGTTAATTSPSRTKEPARSTVISPTRPAIGERILRRSISASSPSIVASSTSRPPSSEATSRSSRASSACCSLCPVRRSTSARAAARSSASVAERLDSASAASRAASASDTSPSCRRRTARAASSSWKRAPASASLSRAFASSMRARRLRPVAQRPRARRDLGPERPHLPRDGREPGPLVVDVAAERLHIELDEDVARGDLGPEEVEADRGDPPTEGRLDAVCRLPHLERALTLASYCPTRARKNHASQPPSRSAPIAAPAIEPRWPSVAITWIERENPAGMKGRDKVHERRMRRKSHPSPGSRR